MRFCIHFFNAFKRSVQERDLEERGDGDGDMDRVEGGRAVSRLRGGAGPWMGGPFGDEWRCTCNTRNHTHSRARENWRES